MYVMTIIDCEKFTHSVYNMLHVMTEKLTHFFLSFYNMDMNTFKIFLLRQLVNDWKVDLLKK